MSFILHCISQMEARIKLAILVDLSRLVLSHSDFCFMRIKGGCCSEKPICGNGGGPLHNE